MKWLLCTVALLVLAGCVDSVEHRIGGAFTTERTSEDLAAFDAKVLEFGGESVLMESWPEQFRATFPSESACNSFHNWAHSQSFIDQARDNHCEVV